MIGNDWPDGGTRDYSRRRDEFARAGFSKRAAGVLAMNDEIATLADLRKLRWEDLDGEPGLMRRLLRTPNCGQAVLREVEAFRAHGDPRRRLAPTARVTIELDAVEARRLDQWIEDHGGGMSRPQAVKAMLERTSPDHNIPARVGMTNQTRA